MLKKEELYDCNKNPKINDISLNLLREYYQSYLYPYQYEYDIEYKCKEVKIVEKIKIKFDKDKFCHLLAIEKIVFKSKNFEEIKGFKGFPGWDNIENEIITIAELKKLNKSLFKSNKDKYVYFYLIPKIMKNPMIKKYDKNKVEPKTEIDSKFIFYDNNVQAYFHLGLDIDENGTYYPRSFFIERIKNSDGKKYIIGQDDVKIINKKIEKVNWDKI